MNNEYIIINRTAIQKRIEELEKECKDLNTQWHDRKAKSLEIIALKQILSQSIPLIPEVKKAFDAGQDLSGRANFKKGTKEYNSYIDKQDYISNLKLDI